MTTDQNAIAVRNQDEDLALFQSMPILHEDDPEWDMGEANLHSLAEDILRYGMTAHLAPQPAFRVYANLNLHYQPRFPSIYVSPDVMAAKPFDPSREDLDSYLLGRDGPAPLFVAEVLSPRTAEEHDLKEKVFIYAMTGIDEYLLVDPSGRFLPERLVLKHLQPDRTWRDARDADGGVTSRLGFRVVWDTDGRLRVLDAATGKRYARPDEAQTEADARHQAEERIRELEAELARLREAKAKGQATRKAKKRRRKP